MEEQEAGGSCLIKCRGRVLSNDAWKLRNTMAQDFAM